jgi:hypothetical protein
LYGELGCVDDALFTEAEDILELELFCATAYPPVIAVLVIMDTTSINEPRRTVDLPIKRLLLITIVSDKKGIKGY